MTDENVSSRYSVYHNNVSEAKRTSLLRGLFRRFDGFADCASFSSAHFCGADDGVSSGRAFSARFCCCSCCCPPSTDRLEVSRRPGLADCCLAFDPPRDPCPRTARPLPLNPAVSGPFWFFEVNPWLLACATLCRLWTILPELSCHPRGAFDCFTFGWRDFDAAVVGALPESEALLRSGDCDFSSLGNCWRSGS